MIGLDNRLGPKRALTARDEARVVSALGAGASPSALAGAFGVDVRTVHRICPESYDAYDERGVRVARLRLRHGAFRAELEDGTVVFRSRPRGDGMFEADERMPQLRAAASAIASARRGQ